MDRRTGDKMSDTKTLERILNWKLNPLANSERPMVTRDDFDEAAAELTELKFGYQQLIDHHRISHEQDDHLRAELDEARKVIERLYKPAKIAVNQIICMCEKDDENLCQPCENREALAIALDGVSAFLKAHPERK
jgi:hypothetical protein